VLIGIIEKKSWPHISGHGSADIAISAVTALVDIGFTATNGEPGCTCITDGVTVGSFSVKIHGSESWMINIFLDIFKSKIKDAVTKGIKEGIQKAINNNLNHVLQTLPLKENIRNILTADFTLVDAPRFGANYMVTDLKGEFFGVKVHQEAPFQPVAIPDVQNTNVMVQATIAQYVPDTVGFALWKDGLLQAKIDDSMIPKDSPVRFNTDSLRYIIPPLYTAFPSKQLQATIDPTDTPLTTFEANGNMGVNAKFEMKWYAVVNNKTNELKYAFNLGINLVAKGEVKLRNHDIYVNVTYGNITLSLRDSQIGQFDLNPLNDIALLVLSEGIPFVNNYFEKGVPLPQIPHVELINPYLGYGNGYIFVNTDFKYTPQTLLD